MRTNGKTIVVTGAGSGMGRELALLLLSKGAKVAAVDINEETARETASLAGKDADIEPFITDQADRAAAIALPGRVIERFGAVDAIINNAGIIQPMVKVADLDDATIDKVLAVNLYGVINMTRAFLPHLLQRPEGHIVNVSSMGGFLPVPGQTVYGASKAGVKLFTEGLHSELRDTNVRVTVVFPGAIHTNIASNSGLGDLSLPEASKPPPMLAADTAARLIVDAMEKDRYRVLVGSDAKLMDALYRIAPRQAAAFIYRQMRSLLEG